MNRRARLCIGLAAAIAVLFALLGPASAAKTHAHRLDVMAAARSCADGKPLRAALGERDLAFVRRFAPCALRAERRQLGLGYQLSPQLTRDESQALGVYIASRALRLGDVGDSNRLYAGSAAQIADQACMPGLHGLPLLAPALLDSHAPPTMTPLLIAKQFVPSFKRVARRPGALLALVVRRGLLFRGSDRHGVSLAYIAVVCRHVSHGPLPPEIIPPAHN